MPIVALGKGRSMKFEQFIIAAYNPPANMKGAQMPVEDDTLGQTQAKALGGAKPPR